MQRIWIYGVSRSNVSLVFVSQMLLSSALFAGHLLMACAYRQDVTPASADKIA